MTKWNFDAMYDLRQFIWTNLQDSGIIDKDDYYSDNLGKSIVPILPVQQQPEMNQFLNNKTHIVYDKVGMSYEDNWAICCEQILFTIYDSDYAKINEIRNFMVDLFRRMDESAGDLNRYSGLSEKFKFHSIYIADISPTSPSEEIQGFLSADVVLEVKYSRILDGSGRYL
jgi:hypothetical protein